MLPQMVKIKASKLHLSCTENLTIIGIGARRVHERWLWLLIGLVKSTVYRSFKIVMGLKPIFNSVYNSVWLF
jgi:hypothetical protein